MSEDSLFVAARDMRLAVGRVARRLRQLYAAEPDPRGGSVMEVAVLSRLDQDGPSFPSALAAREHVSSQAVAAALGRLERAGLVDRRADHVDRRRVRVAITAAGSSSLRARHQTITTRLSEVLASHLTDAERRRLAAAVPLLERLADEL